MNGKQVDWKDATVHVLSHAPHYGTGCSEGIRSTRPRGGRRCSAAHEHLRADGALGKDLLMDIPYSVDELIDATHD